MTFPTLDLRGWGFRWDSEVPSDFPPAFGVGSRVFKPLLRDGKIQGWWVDGDFFDDTLLEDPWGETHVIFLKE